MGKVSKKFVAFVIPFRPICFTEFGEFQSPNLGSLFNLMAQMARNEQRHCRVNVDWDKAYGKTWQSR